MFQKIDKSEVLKHIIYGHTRFTKYPPEVRKFCLSLSYHSPAAYRIVRDYFDKSLPHPKVLTTWLKESDINGDYGIGEETMKRLSGFVEELKNTTGEQLVCSLLLDEMYIRKQLYWDSSKYEYAGFPTYVYTDGTTPQKPNEINEIGANDKPTRRETRASVAKSNRRATTDAESIDLDRDILDVLEEDEMNTSGSSESSETVVNEENDKTKKSKCPLATRALVFMLSGINKMFEFPVGYHFVNGLGADGLTELVKEVVIKVSKCGVKIVNITMDGAKENLKMCENLGAHLDPLSDEFKPFFPSPFDGTCLFVILDPSHMEKLLRNLLGNHKKLFDKNNEEIKWAYFVNLQKLSKDGGLLTHKLTKKHTAEWVRNKMNVRLACETFSGSVADSFQILREREHKKFINSLATENFTRMADKMFDILNSRDTRHSNMFKRPLNAENKDAIFEFMEQCKISLLGLKMYSRAF